MLENQSSTSKAKRRGFGSVTCPPPLPKQPRAVGSLKARGTDRGKINEQEQRRSAARVGAPGDLMKMREGGCCVKSKCELVLF